MGSVQLRAKPSPSRMASSSCQGPWPGLSLSSLRAIVCGALNTPVSLKRILLPLGWYPQSLRKAWLLHTPTIPMEWLHLTPGPLFWFPIPSPGNWLQSLYLTLTPSLMCCNVHYAGHPKPSSEVPVVLPADSYTRLLPLKTVVLPKPWSLP